MCSEQAGGHAVLKTLQTAQGPLGTSLATCVYVLRQQWKASPACHDVHLQNP